MAIWNILMQVSIIMTLYVLYVLVIWHIFLFGKLYQEKSGNPVSESTLNDISSTSAIHWKSAVHLMPAEKNG
jgi:hypothetical protein